MTSPQSAGKQVPSAPQRFVVGAIDLGAVKEQAQLREKRQAAMDASAASAASGVAVEKVATVSPENFEAELVVRSTQVPVVLLLGSARSEASEGMRRAFESMAQSQEEISWLFRYAGVDTQAEIAQVFGIQSIPTVIALAQGRPLTNFEGAQPAEQLQGWVDAVVRAAEGKLAGLPQVGTEQGAEAEDQADPRLEQAAEKLAAEDYAGAVAAYDAILNAEAPGSEVYAEAKSARANALIMQRLFDGGDEFAEADQLLLGGDKAAAFGLLIEQIRDPQTREAAKARLLELFSLFDAADPEVIAARTQMASALF